MKTEIILKTELRLNFCDNDIVEKNDPECKSRAQLPVHLQFTIWKCRTNQTANVCRTPQINDDTLVRAPNGMTQNTSEMHIGSHRFLTPATLQKNVDAFKRWASGNKPFCLRNIWRVCPVGRESSSVAIWG
jgi:hypothetical protein